MNCKELSCSEKTKDCRCYARIDAKDQKKEQFCGYRKNSFIIPCDAACCNGGEGCPGQCKGVSERPPYAIDQNPLEIDRFPLYLKMAIFLIIVLLVLSTLSA